MQNGKSLSSAGRFWQLIAEDHLWFIYDALGKDELDWILRVKELYDSSSKEIKFLEQTLQLKRELLAAQLRGEVVVDLAPTFINHMINEVEEGLKELRGKKVHVLKLHELWLNDAEGHLVAIMHKLDPVEKELKKLLKKEKKNFHCLFAKTLEFIGYLRSGEHQAILFETLTGQAEAETLIYLELLQLIAAQVENNTIAHHLHPLLVDHMLREQSYYLTKIAADTDSAILVDPYERGVPYPGF